jgi:hypothetical protein
MGPSALLSPGPAQTSDMSAFAAAAQHYAQAQHSHFSSFGPPPSSLNHQHPPTSSASEAAESLRTPADENGPSGNVPPPFFGPLSPQQGRVAMTPSMPGFSFHPFPQTPPLLPQFLSPGLGPFSPPLGTPHGPHPTYINAAPGAPLQYGMGTPTAIQTGFGPSYFPSVGAALGHQHGYEAPTPTLSRGDTVSASSSDVSAANATVNGETPATGAGAGVKSATTSPKSTSPPQQVGSGGKLLESATLFTPGSALAARRASNNPRTTSAGNLGLLPSAMDGLSNGGPHSNTSSASPGSGSQEDLVHRTARLDLEGVAPPRRASFFDSGAREAAAETLRKAAGNSLAAPESTAMAAPRRSSFDGSAMAQGGASGAGHRAASDSKTKPKRTFGHSIWQV